MNMVFDKILTLIQHMNSTRLEKPFSFDSMLSEADQNMYIQKQREK